MVVVSDFFHRKNDDDDIWVNLSDYGFYIYLYLGLGLATILVYSLKNKIEINGYHFYVLNFCHSVYLFLVENGLLWNDDSLCRNYHLYVFYDEENRIETLNGVCPSPCSLFLFVC